jgi:hypothetical protein
MLKPDLVRAALAAVLPDYAKDPDRLSIFIDQGTVATRLLPGKYSFEYRYRLHAILLDFAGDPDAVMAALVRFLQEQQLDLLQNQELAKQAIGFEAEILDGGKMDLALTLQLTEAVRLVPREGGGHDIVHLPEPPPAAPLIPGFDAPATPAPLGSLWLGGEQLLPPA